MWKFIKSSSSKENWYLHNLKEICFIGRSNVGKSSLINSLANNKQLARTSKTPGRTQLINYFLVEENNNKKVIVDLPGYGFAKLSIAEQEKMFSMVDQYFHYAKPVFVFFLIDSRRSIQKHDLKIIDYLKSLSHNIIFVLTKLDKANQKELNQTLSNELIKNSKYFLFSIHNKTYISKLKNFILNI